MQLSEARQDRLEVGTRRLTPIRASVVGYLNARPLWDALAEDDAFDVRTGVPSEVTSRLAAGDADVALVSSIELLRDGVRRLSGACIASDGPVTSVLVALATAPGRVRRLAVDPSSRTSQRLAEIILRGYGADPEVEEHDPTTALDAGFDAALVIGDPAFAFAKKGYPVLDLASEWGKTTGLPFVFGVWAAPAEKSPEEVGILEDALDRARERGLERIPEMARRAAASGLLSEAEARVYLTRRIRYRFGEREAAGLRAYLDAVRALPGEIRRR